MSYQAFLNTKAPQAYSVGRIVDPVDLNPHLFPFQKKLVEWALRKGRAAIFADTGLGKTLMQLAWAQKAATRVLILSPLAVSKQTVNEGARFGIEVTYCRHQHESPENGITITNYEMLKNFHPESYGAVVLDESSILKGFDGKTRNLLVDSFAKTPMRLACTATPSPNDIVEIGNHAEFLGVMSMADMKATFFKHEHDKAQDFVVKGHARNAFFRWLASWGMSIRMPSDLGFDDTGYDLPGLSINPIFTSVGYVPRGMMFATEIKGVGDRARIRRETLNGRVDAAVKLIEENPTEPFLVWVGLNDEGIELAKRIPGSINVDGAMHLDKKADAMIGFSDGSVRVLISKPSICGFGMNWQHCNRMAFVGLSDSFEQYYQCIRRCYRFGQKREVTASIILSELERPIFDNVLRKEGDAKRMGDELIKHVAEFERAEIGMTNRDRTDYQPSERMRMPQWV